MTSISRRYTAALLTCASLLLCGVVHAQPRAGARRRTAAAQRVGGVRVAPANVFDAMYFRERADSRISPAALAAYGNRLVARRGLDFWFDSCDVVRADKSPRPAREVSESAQAFAYTLRRVGGGAVNFQLIADLLGETPGESQCGECLFPLPALRVAEREMLVVVGGRRYLLERPRGFLLREVSLVAGSPGVMQRSWQLPYQNVPLGLSADRRKLYLPLPDFDDVEWDDQLALELSDAGVRFVARERLSLPKYERLTDAREGDDTERIYYVEGGSSYLLHVTDPCR